jgi:hypothetical protein
MTEAASAQATTTQTTAAADAGAGTQAAVGSTTTATTEQKTGAAATQTSAAEFTLKAPEGFDAAALPKIAEVAKTYGLTPAAAQKLLDDTHANQTKAKAELDASLAKQKAEWHDAIKADKEYGGEKFAASLQRAQKVVGEVDAKIAPGIKQLLDDSGYGEHPAVVRLFNYLGQANREDTFAAGGDNAARNAPKTLAETLYPKT